MLSEPILMLFQIGVLIYSVVLHEVSHGLAARALGDPTAERLGRLTLNPLKHLDLFGSFLLPLMSILLGGFVIGYAKPIPYNPENLRDPVHGPVKVGMAGPATNLFIAVVFGMVMRLAGQGLSETALVLMGYVVWINIILAFFNLIPVPPLDGHWLLMSLLPRRYYLLRVALYRYQLFLLILAIFVFFPIMYPVLLGLFRLLTGAHLF